ncbi:Kinesin-like protein KIN-14S, partial [Linum grandiflorum]
KGSNSVVEFDSSQDNELQILYSDSSTLQFKFDHVFKTEDNQEAVFARTKPVITLVLDGYDVCIFSYGKNRTGKTFRMEGPLENRGVNYRSRKELFRISEERKVYMKYELYVSKLEVYNGKLRYLLVRNSKLHSKQLDIKQVPKGKGRTSQDGTVIEETELRKRCISLNVQSYSSLLCVYWFVLLFVHPNVSTKHIMQLLRLVEFEWCYGFKVDGAVKYKQKMQYSNSRVVKKVNEKHITSVFTFKEDSIENKAFCQVWLITVTRLFADRFLTEVWCEMGSVLCFGVSKSLGSGNFPNYKELDKDVAAYVQWMNLDSREFLLSRDVQLVQILLQGRCFHYYGLDVFLYWSNFAVSVVEMDAGLLIIGFSRPHYLVSTKYWIWFIRNAETLVSLPECNYTHEFYHMLGTPCLSIVLEQPALLAFTVTSFDGSTSNIGRQIVPDCQVHWQATIIQQWRSIICNSIPHTILLHKNSSGTFLPWVNCSSFPVQVYVIWGAIFYLFIGLGTS